MSRRILCDGCDQVLPPHDVALRGDAGPGRPSVAPLPIRDFHLCAPCAVVGFEAIQAAVHAARNEQTPSTNLTRDV